MRGRSYGILIAGALLSALPWLVIGQLMARHQIAHERSRAEHAGRQLCLALSAASVDLAAPTSLEGARPKNAMSRLLGALKLHRLTAEPGSSVREPPEVASSCPAAAGDSGLSLMADPNRPERLVLSLKESGSGKFGERLLLDTRALLGGEGEVRLLSPSEARSQAESSRSEQLRFADASLLVSIPPHRNPQEEHQSRTLAAALAALGLLLTTTLALRSEAEGRRQRQRLYNLRHDSQTGLLSGLALKEDLAGGSDHDPQQEPALLAMVNLRLLQRQGPFRRDEEIRALFSLVRDAVQATERIGPTPRFYRASENRLGLLLQVAPEDDEALLGKLERKIRAVLEEKSGTSLRADDILITAQRLPFGTSAASRLDLHGYGETLARAAGRSVRLIEAEDDLRVMEEAAIRDQLQNLGPEDIQLEFQPILLLASPGHFGLEALVRFLPAGLREHSTGRLVTTAHELGIADRIDAHVLRQLPSLLEALQANPWLDERIAYIALNISGDSFSSPQRLEQLIGTLQELAIDPARFYVEFTETATSDQLGDSAAVTIASERLTRELKLRIAIDDFGSGLSNYRRICEAWYDTVKLDIALVAGIGSSFRMQRYVGSLIETVHALGKTVICEGVENHADLSAAIRLGADAVQGYLIARPMAWQAIPTFLAESDWASPAKISAMVAKIRSSDRLVLPEARAGGNGAAVPLERQILDNWYELRSFEEFLLLFVNELKRWGLDILRLSLAFLPDQDDIDCSQYVWLPARPGEVRSLRMDRAFLQQKEHINSALHHIATQARFYRERLASRREVEFRFLEQLKEQGCNDYLGLRLDSRGISIPVLTIALRGDSSFSDEQIQRIVSMSSLLSLLFYTFESERAKRLALLDALTELPNRRSFDSFLRANLNASRLNHTSLALALIDIDRFKQVNDSFGHAYGDACLREVASILSTDLRRNRDFVARLGGEEFALILPETNAEEARQLCEVLREAVTRARVPTGDGRPEPPLSISLGIAVWDPNGSEDGDADRLLQLADDGLYQAKREGRNRVVCRVITT